MEILKSLSEPQLDSLRSVFDCAPYSSLDDETFKSAIRHACKATRLPLSDEYLDQLFASVDVSGRGRVSWSDFSMFAIEQANITEEDGLTLQRGKQQRKARKTDKKDKNTTRKNTEKDDDASPDGKCTQSGPSPKPTPASKRKSGDKKSRHASQSAAASTGGDDDDASQDDETDDEMELDIFAAFHPFSVDSVIPHPFGKQVNLARYFSRQRRLVTSMNDVKGNSYVTVYDVHDGGKGMSIHGRVPKQPEAIIDWDMIPVTGGVGFSNSLVTSYQGGVVQLFSLQKKHSFEDVLPFCKSLTFSETQTCLVWSSLYNRLLLGSRGGVLSIWDVDGDAVFSQEKLHTEAITKLVVRNGCVYSSSLDRFNSVKTVDVEHSLVTNAFNDHMLGGATTLAVSDDYLFSGGFESKIVQRALQTPRAQPSFLYDSAEPHTGRLTCLELLPNSPLLMSSDSHGMLKVWDLRVGACLQTLYPANAAGHKARQEREARQLKRNHKTDGNRKGQLRGTSPAAANVGTKRGAAAAGGGGGAAGLVSSSSGATGAGTPSAVTSAAVLESGVDVGCISSICPIPKLGTIMVTNDAEMITYTSLSSSSPDLVDDQRACRFLLMPSPTQVLTVHERGVKLWRLDSGHLVYATDNDLVNGDVSCCAIIVPLRRQFLLGTMEGEVKAFSVALGQQTMDMSGALLGANLFHKEVLSLHVLPKFRDYASPYVVITHEDGVALCPMMEGSFSSAVVRLHVLVGLLENGRYKIKESRLSEDMSRLLVATTRNCTYLIDLAQVGSVVATYTVTASLENTIFNFLKPLHPFLAAPPNVAADGTVLDDAHITEEVEQAEAAAKRRMTVSMLAMSIVTQQRQSSSTTAAGGSQRARTQSVIAREALALAQRKREEAYLQQLHPILASTGTSTGTAADDAPTGAAAGYHAQAPTESASVAVYRYMLAMADSQGKVAVGYAQTVRRVTDHRGVVTTAEGPAAATASGPSQETQAVEDRYPVLGEWCAAKNEPTWKWAPPPAPLKGPGTALTTERSVAASSRGNNGPRSTQQNSQQQRLPFVSRKSRGRFPVTSSSFLAEVVASPDDATSPLFNGNPATSSPFGGLDGTLSGATMTANSTLVLNMSEQQQHQQQRTSDTPPLAPVSVRLRRSAMPVVTHMHFYPDLQLLATGNEHGDIKIWDFAGVFLSGPQGPVATETTMAGAASSSGRYAPVLVHEWHAHKNGFTAFIGYNHPESHLPVLLSCGADRAATVWSTDGVVVGTLATGRQLDDRSGGNRFALPPFQLEACGSLACAAEHWAHLLDYLMERGKTLNQRLPTQRKNGAAGFRQSSAFAQRDDVPPLSLTLTGRGRRRSSTATTHSPRGTRAHSLNDSQNSFFLTDGGTPSVGDSEQFSPRSPSAYSPPRPLGRTSVAREDRLVASKARVLPSTQLLGPGVSHAGTVAAADDSVNETEAQAILAELNSVHAASSPTQSAFMRRAVNVSSGQSPSGSTGASGATQPTLEAVQAISKTARLVYANRSSRKSSLTAKSPYTLAHTGAAPSAKRASRVSGNGCALPLLSPRGGVVKDNAAAPQRNWGAMPCRFTTAPQRTGGAAGSVPSTATTAGTRAVSSPASLLYTADRTGIVRLGDVSNSERGIRDVIASAPNPTFAANMLPPAGASMARSQSEGRQYSEPSRGGAILSTRSFLPRL